MSSPQHRPGGLSLERLAGIRRGIEKESLRAHADGKLALTPHPALLGSPLTHPSITTDFSESQLELITGVHDSVSGCIDELRRIHQFVYRSIGDETLWVGSMPCVLPADETIPIASYGTSNTGRMKSVYRMGLGHRYGRRMQTISGIHYNWSMPGTTSEDYFALIRNFRRHSFLLLLLFGASPAVCSTFVEGRDHPLQPVGRNTLGMPHATSLRMGRLGYQSDAQASLAVSYNDLENYAASLHQGLTRSHPAYEAIGIRNPGGEYNQLATTLLQIENEFYSAIRPKRVIQPGERPLHALRERGVEYVEVRCMDLDPFVSEGITASTARFIDLFLLHCLFTDSPRDTPQEIAALARNQERVAARGREPGLMLERGGQEVLLADWAAELVEELAPFAMTLDTALGGTAHAASLQSAEIALQDFDRLPSARVMHEMGAGFEGNHVDFIRSRSAIAARELLASSTPPGHDALMRDIADESFRAQSAVEAADQLGFEAYRRAYLSPERLMPETAASAQ